MKPMHLPRSLLLLILLAPEFALASKTGCHLLMTDAECASHLDHLALLAPGAARERYLAGFLAQRREREAACRCVGERAHNAAIKTPAR